MISDYAPILVLSLVAGGFAAVNVVATLFIGPYRPTREKLAPYESGMTEIQPPKQRFPIKFYVIAMLFCCSILRRCRFTRGRSYFDLCASPDSSKCLFCGGAIGGIPVHMEEGALDWE
jgi:hypothetical protein